MSAEETPKTEKLSDKRWILKHVLVPIVLAMIPCYFAWLQGRAMAQAEGVETGKLERQANLVIIRALMEQIAADETSESPVESAPATTPELAEALRDLPAHNHIDMEPMQAQQHIGQIIQEYEELEDILPEKLRDEIRSRVAEGARR